MVLPMTTLKTFFKDIVRWSLSLIKPVYFKRCLANSILKKDFYPSIAKSPFFDRRDQLWDYCIQKLGKDSLVVFIEFGVWRGVSIKHFANGLVNKDSLFIGLDTFTGLPQDWDTAGMSRGSLSADGLLPDIKDERVRFIRGLFQETSAEWLGIVEQVKSTHQVIVHFDADLYSSTLYALSKFSKLGIPFYAIFDEFYGDECRALSDFCDSFQYRWRVLGHGGRGYSKGGHEGKVAQVNCFFYIDSVKS